MAGKVEDHHHNDTEIASTVIQENAQLKKDLDFANSEINRLRAKLIIDDEDMPSLSSELLGSTKVGSNMKSNNENEIDTSGRTTNDFMSLKESINLG